MMKGARFGGTAPDKYPDTPELRRYLETYNTRAPQATAGSLVERKSGSMPVAGGE